jgi:alpha-L-fucosidase
LLATALFCQTALAQSPQIADGPFQGDVESLRQYQCPDWFRDAKFGIWAHWGPQAVPMEGDWYAIALGWPEDGKLLVRSLATTAGKVNSVSLLGYDGKVDWQQTDAGLAVTVPARPISRYTCALKVTGEDLKPVPIPEVVITVSPDAQGNYRLNPDDATLGGDQIKVEAQGGQPNIGFWDRADESVAWTLDVNQPGTFAVRATVATIHDNAEFVVDAAGQQLAGKPPRTESWADFRDIELGTLRLTTSEKQLVTVRARDATSWKAINLRLITLTRVR